MLLGVGGGVGAGHAHGIARAACKPGDKALCFGGGHLGPLFTRQGGVIGINNKIAGGVFYLLGLKRQLTLVGAVFQVDVFRFFRRRSFGA